MLTEGGFLRQRYGQGQKLQIKTGTNGTLGFPAVNSEGVKGFVTAGHVAPGIFRL